MSPLQYLTEEWRAEAERRLKSELTPERMNHITSSMSNVYLDCPGGGSKYLLFRFADGALAELALGTGAARGRVPHHRREETWAGGQALMPSLGGSIAAFHSQALGVIRPDPIGPGFRKIIIKPSVVGGLHWVESHYDSVHGRIIRHWRRRGDQLLMEVTIPANTTASVFVPAQDAAGVTESGKPAAQAEGVKLLRMENNGAVHAVGSGTYRFQSTLLETRK